MTFDRSSMGALGWAFYLSPRHGRGMLVHTVRKQTRIGRRLAGKTCGVIFAALAVAVGSCLAAQPPAGRSSSKPASALSGMVNQYCVDCHNADKKKGDLDLSGVLSD